ncbi:1419_t:CDS:10 [Funneliformis caledonium]|uniref:1419_t:CDS:1 n=1 Tax=Funneliformis caledonium TaxID=1117310 RepID=A0A9N9HEE3_9GLOM|nr:1419_t:CDS:10 [Funneliformis caledonium]
MDHKKKWWVSHQAGHSKDDSLVLASDSSQVRRSRPLCFTTTSQLASDSSQVRRSRPSCLTKLWLIGFIKHIESLPCFLKFDKKNEAEQNAYSQDIWAGIRHPTREIQNMVRNPGVRKQREEAQIDWMLQSETPTPLSFFRFVDASERSRSIQKYSKILMKAIGRKGNSDRLNSVLDKFNKGEYKDDWEIWKKERTKSVTVTNIVETNFEVHDRYNSTFTRALGKRNSNYVNPGSSKKVRLSQGKDSEDNKDSDEEDSDDDELLPMKITDSVTVRRLAKIGKGIARYNVVFLPETNKNVILRREFDDEEWQILENVFYNKDNEISLEAPPQLHKVETILNDYDESLEKATEDNFVDLDSVLLCLVIKAITSFEDTGSSEYQYRSWFVNLPCEDMFLDLNNTIRLPTGEIENVDRKNQKVLSKSPEERRSTGWYHDGILTININGINFQIGFLEVVGNAIVEDHKKMTTDLQKILKAMRLAFFQLTKTLWEKGITDEEKLKRKLETYGIFVDNTPTQLCLLKDIVTGLLSFRARVEHTYTQITNLLKSATSRRRPRRMKTDIDVSPELEPIFIS